MKDAGPIRRAIGRAYRTVVGVRVVESLLLGLAAVLVLWCALALEGLPTRGADVWVLSSVAFAAAAGSWFAAHGTNPSRLALAADRDLQWGGALKTAYEVEARTSASAVESLLLAHVRSELRPRAIRSAVAPNSVPVIAVPFLAMALFGSIRTGEESVGNEVPELLRRAMGELEAAGGASAELDDEVRREWGLAQTEARSLAEQIQRGAASENIDVGLSDLERSLEELASKLPPDSELARDVARARENLDAARLGKPSATEEPGSEEAGSTPGDESGAGVGGAQEGGVEPGSGGASGSSAVDGRPVPIDTSGTGEAERQVERAGGVGRWWPARHDGVVRGWIELSRPSDGH